jgi:signal peptidase I
MMDEEQRALEQPLPGAGGEPQPPGNGRVPPGNGVPPTAGDGRVPLAGPAGDGAAGPAAERGEAGSPGAEGGDGAKDGDGGKPGQPGKPKRKRKQRGSFLRELPILVVIALTLALLIKTYAFQAYFIPSGSMQNTLEIGDKVLVNKIVYHLRPIHRGDIVVFNGQGSWNPGPGPSTPNPFDRLYHAVIGLFGAAPGQTDYIKRVIGIPGDHVKCCNAHGQVTVNGVPLSEKSYLYAGNAPSVAQFSITVPSGRLWVMGDHRAVSDDSRDHAGYPGGGTIPENQVVGRAFWIVWPPSRWRVLPIPATFQNPALNSSKSSTTAHTAPPAVISARIAPAAPVLPLAAGFVGAIPLTWAQLRMRRGFRRQLARRRAAGHR